MAARKEKMIFILIITLFSIIIMINTRYVFAEEATYETTLFNDNIVHSIDIIVNPNDWNKMIKNARQEKYIKCSLCIDGEKIENVGIRPKGNSSLDQVAKAGSERFSFKVEFDHYVKDQKYKGLDKLTLNNSMLDTTYMKDYLSYHMMNYVGIPSPLSSFSNITINEKPFGLYVAVEAIEDSFAERNYGEEHGNLYKPEGLAVDNFSFDSMKTYKTEDGKTAVEGMLDTLNGTAFSDIDDNQYFDVTGYLLKLLLESNNVNVDMAAGIYDGDDLENYSDIFDFSVFKIKEKDKKRLVESIRKLSKSEELEKVLDIDKLIKFFVVNNFINNYDGYTTLLAHNFYLHEKSGQLSIVPWDYNCGFGIHNVGILRLLVTDGIEKSVKIPDYKYGMDLQKSMVNYPIDTPLSTTTLEQRPLFGKWFQEDEYRNEYHQYYNEFLNNYFENGYFEELYNKTVEMIDPYVKKDPTAFYGYNEFLNGTQELKKFCLLRAESIRGQVDGTIPATCEGQSNSINTLINTDDLDLYKTSDIRTGGVKKYMQLLEETIPNIIDYLPSYMVSDGKLDLSAVTMDNINALKKQPMTLIKVAFAAFCSSSILRQMVFKAIWPYFLVLLILIVGVFELLKYMKNRRLQYRKAL